MSIVLTFVNASGIGLTLSLAAAMSRAFVAPSAVMSAHRAVAMLALAVGSATLAKRIEVEPLDTSENSVFGPNSCLPGVVR